MFTIYKMKINKINETKTRYTCTYCKKAPCRESYMCKKRKQVETKLGTKIYVSPDHIQNIRQNF